MYQVTKNLLAILGVVGLLYLLTNYVATTAYQKGLDAGIQQAEVWQSDKKLVSDVCTSWWFAPQHRLSKRKPS